MPTETQKKFREEMKRFQEEQRRNGLEDKYTPSKRTKYTDPGEENNKIKVITGVVILTLILLAYSNINNPKTNSSIVRGLDPKYKNRVEVYEYLRIIKPILYKKNDTLTRFNELGAQWNNQNITLEDFQSELVSIREDIWNLQVELEGMKVPAETSQIHNIFLLELWDLFNGTRYVYNAISFSIDSASNNQLASKYLNEASEKSKKFMSEIVIIFDKYGVRYSQEPDKIRYYLD
ncbi:MAG: hypothetical protein KGZ96_08265 [Clostridia bacterium]|nr:hypothetical protein [Clostridia bacterium]